MAVHGTAFRDELNAAHRIVKEESRYGRVGVRHPFLDLRRCLRFL